MPDRCCPLCGGKGTFHVGPRVSLRERLLTLHGLGQKGNSSNNKLSESFSSSHTGLRNTSSDHHLFSDSSSPSHSRKKGASFNHKVPSYRASPSLIQKASEVIKLGVAVTHPTGKDFSCRSSLGDRHPYGGADQISVRGGRRFSQKTRLKRQQQMQRRVEQEKRQGRQQQGFAGEKDFFQQLPKQTRLPYISQQQKQLRMQCVAIRGGQRPTSIPKNGACGTFDQPFREEKSCLMCPTRRLEDNFQKEKQEEQIFTAENEDDDDEDKQRAWLRQQLLCGLEAQERQLQQCPFCVVAAEVSAAEAHDTKKNCSKAAPAEYNDVPVYATAIDAPDSSRSGDDPADVGAGKHTANSHTGAVIGTTELKGTSGLSNLRHSSTALTINTKEKIFSVPIDAARAAKVQQQLNQRLRENCNCITVEDLTEEECLVHFVKKEVEERPVAAVSAEGRLQAAATPVQLSLQQQEKLPALSFANRQVIAQLVRQGFPFERAFEAVVEANFSPILQVCQAHAEELEAKEVSKLLMDLGAVQAREHLDFSRAEQQRRDLSLLQDPSNACDLLWQRFPSFMQTAFVSSALLRAWLGVESAAAETGQTGSKATENRDALIATAGRAENTCSSVGAGPVGVAVADASAAASAGNVAVTCAAAVAAGYSTAVSGGSAPVRAADGVSAAAEDVHSSSSDAAAAGVSVGLANRRLLFKLLQLKASACKAYPLAAPAYLNAQDEKLQLLLTLCNKKYLPTLNYWLLRLLLDIYKFSLEKKQQNSKLCGGVPSNSAPGVHSTSATAVAETDTASIVTGSKAAVAAAATAAGRTELFEHPRCATSQTNTATATDCTKGIERSSNTSHYNSGAAAFPSGECFATYRTQCEDAPTESYALHRQLDAGAAAARHCKSDATPANKTYGAAVAISTAAAANCSVGNAEAGDVTTLPATAVFPVGDVSTYLDKCHDVDVSTDCMALTSQQRDIGFDFLASTSSNSTSHISAHSVGATRRSSSALYELNRNNRRSSFSYQESRKNDTADFSASQRTNKGVLEKKQQTNVSLTKNQPRNGELLVDEKRNSALQGSIETHTKVSVSELQYLGQDQRQRQQQMEAKLRQGLVQQQEGAKQRQHQQLFRLHQAAEFEVCEPLRSAVTVDDSTRMQRQLGKEGVDGETACTRRADEVLLEELQRQWESSDARLCLNVRQELLQALLQQQTEELQDILYFSNIGSVGAPPAFLQARQFRRLFFLLWLVVGELLRRAQPGKPHEQCLRFKQAQHLAQQQKHNQHQQQPHQVRVPRQRQNQQFLRGRPPMHEKYSTHEPQSQPQLEQQVQHLLLENSQREEPSIYFLQQEEKHEDWGKLYNNIGLPAGLANVYVQIHPSLWPPTLVVRANASDPNAAQVVQAGCSTCGAPSHLFPAATASGSAVKGSAASGPDFAEKMSYKQCIAQCSGVSMPPNVANAACEKNKHSIPFTAFYKGSDVDRSPLLSSDRRSRDPEQMTSNSVARKDKRRSKLNNYVKCHSVNSPICFLRMRDEQSSRFAGRTHPCPVATERKSKSESSKYVKPCAMSEKTSAADVTVEPRRCERDFSSPAIVPRQIDLKSSVAISAHTARNLSLNKKTKLGQTRDAQDECIIIGELLSPSFPALSATCSYKSVGIVLHSTASRRSGGAAPRVETSCSGTSPRQPQQEDSKTTILSTKTNTSTENLNIKNEYCREKGSSRVYVCSGHASINRRDSLSSNCFYDRIVDAEGEELRRAIEASERSYSQEQAAKRRKTRLINVSIAAKPAARTATKMKFFPDQKQGQQLFSAHGKLPHLSLVYGSILKQEKRHALPNSNRKAMNNREDIVATSISASPAGSVGISSDDSSTTAIEAHNNSISSNEFPSFSGSLRNYPLPLKHSSDGINSLLDAYGAQNRRMHTFSQETEAGVTPHCECVRSPQQKSVFHSGEVAECCTLQHREKWECNKSGEFPVLKQTQALTNPSISGHASGSTCVQSSCCRRRLQQQMEKEKVERVMEYVVTAVTLEKLSSASFGKKSEVGLRLNALSSSFSDLLLVAPIRASSTTGSSTLERYGIKNSELTQDYVSPADCVTPLVWKLVLASPKKHINSVPFLREPTYEVEFCGWILPVLYSIDISAAPPTSCSDEFAWDMSRVDIATDHPQAETSHRHEPSLACCNEQRENAFSFSKEHGVEQLENNNRNTANMLNLMRKLLWDVGKIKTVREEFLREAQTEFWLLACCDFHFNENEPPMENSGSNDFSFAVHLSSAELDAEESDNKQFELCSAMKRCHETFSVNNLTTRDGVAKAKDFKQQVSRLLNTSGHLKGAGGSIAEYACSKCQTDSSVAPVLLRTGKWLPASAFCSRKLTSRAHALWARPFEGQKKWCAGCYEKKREGPDKCRCFEEKVPDEESEIAVLPANTDASLVFDLELGEEGEVTVLA